MVYRGALGAICPGCGGALHDQRIARYPVMRCEGCDGIWTARDVFEGIIAELTRARPALTLAHARVDEPRRTCPQCRALMGKRRAADLSVDLCMKHGVWFDAGELELIVSRTAGQPVQAADREASLLHELFTGRRRR